MNLLAIRRIASHQRPLCGLAGAFATGGTGRAMVVKVRLDFLPTRCEAIRFIKIIQSEGDQQIGRHNVPLLTGVQHRLDQADRLQAGARECLRGPASQRIDRP